MLQEILNEITLTELVWVAILLLILAWSYMQKDDTVEDYFFYLAVVTTACGGVVFLGMVLINTLRMIF